MTDLQLSITNWEAAGLGTPEVLASTGRLRLQVGDSNLTEHEDTFSRTIRQEVLVSAYPLALWLAGNWWRLLHEPRPPERLRPTTDWRLAHEWPAANAGTIWPALVMASEGETIQFQATIAAGSCEQSVRYLNTLLAPISISREQVESVLDAFISSVLGRLEAWDGIHTGLLDLWQELKDERADEEASRYRRLEACLGFDPDEAPEALMGQAIHMAATMGARNFSEIAPVYGQASQGNASGLQQLQQLLESPALEARLQLAEIVFQKPIQARTPWRRAQQLARALRQHLGLSNEPIPTDLLCDLFGLSPQVFEATLPTKRQPIAVAIPGPTGHIALHLRKTYPSARRFELARFIGDALITGSRPQPWFVSSDIPTERQKIQRAFAAEFLCPAEGALEQLGGDYSEPAVEQVAERFGVSTEIVENLIANQEVNR
ncbi:MAG: hypothetical protein RLZZ216_1999 [Cyanobacteriota bacterium]|jgi:hypothetical protein